MFTFRRNNDKLNTGRGERMFEKNLKYYRLKKNMSKKELADSMGVSAMTISNYESGKRSPDIEVITKLAEILGVKITDFMATRNSDLVFRHNEFRKHSDLSQSEQEFVQESVEEYFSRFFDAVECLGGNPLPDSPKCHGIKYTGDYEVDSQALRKHLELPKDGPIDELISILENKGIIVFEIEIDNDHFSGMNGTVNDRPYIVINNNITPERKRTTIVHELSHIMFDWGKASVKECEKSCTGIAGAFLITKDDLLRELGPKRTRFTKDMELVCEEYGISIFLLVKRAAQAGIISSSLEKGFYIKANKMHLRENEPQRVRREEQPLLFRQLVLRAINEEGISIQRGAELLKTNYSELEKYCELVVN